MVTCDSYPIRNSLFIYVVFEGMIPIQSNWLVLEARAFVGQFSAQLFPTVLSLYTDFLSISNCSTIFSSHQIWQFALPCTRQFLCCSNIFTSGYPTLKAVIIRLVAWVIDLGCGFKALHLNILAWYTCSIHTDKAI